MSIAPLVAAATVPQPARDASPRGVSTLMYACQQGDVEKVRRILRAQPTAYEKRDRTGKTALHYCCTSDNKCAAQAADLLVMAAPDLVESRDEDGFTPLHLAVIAGNIPLVTFLLANNADFNAVDNEQHTVIHWATVCGETVALRAVLSAGAPVSTPDVHGGYPLHYAAQMCAGEKDSALGLQVLQTLLQHPDIKVNVEDGDGRQPLLWAASAGSAKAVLALIRAGAAAEAPDKDGLTALHCAASRGHTDCIDTLLTLCGMSPDVIDSNGCTALHYSVTLGHADATVLLLAHGADANRQDRKGRSPAHCGCAKGQFETVKMIGAHDANLWLRNARGDLPLHEAAASGRRDLVKWLLESRPSQVNARNNDGRCPLHLAALNDNSDMVKILMDTGAQINPVLRTSKNVFMTPLDCALQRGFRSTAKYLQLHGGVPASRLGSSQIGPISNGGLNLTIREDVTLYGDTSDSERENGDKEDKMKKRHKRKLTYRHEKKQQERNAGSDEAGKLSSGKDKKKGREKNSEKQKAAATDKTYTNSETTDDIRQGDKTSKDNITYSSEVKITNNYGGINIEKNGEIIISDSAPIMRDINLDTKITEATKTSNRVPEKNVKAEKGIISAKQTNVAEADAPKRKVKVDTPDPRRKDILDNILSQSDTNNNNKVDNVIESVQKAIEDIELKHPIAIGENIEEIKSLASTIEQSAKSITKEVYTIQQNLQEEIKFDKIKQPDQQSLISNTSIDDEEEHRSLLVEAAVHEPPKEKDAKIDSNHKHQDINVDVHEKAASSFESPTSIEELHTSKRESLDQDEKKPQDIIPIEETASLKEIVSVETTTRDKPTENELGKQETRLAETNECLASSKDDAKEELLKEETTLIEQQVTSVDKTEAEVVPDADIVSEKMSLDITEERLKENVSAGEQGILTTETIGEQLETDQISIDTEEIKSHAIFLKDEQTSGKAASEDTPQQTQPDITDSLFDERIDQINLIEKVQEVNESVSDKSVGDEVTLTENKHQDIEELALPEVNGSKELADAQDNKEKEQESNSSSKLKKEDIPSKEIEHEVNGSSATVETLPKSVLKQEELQDSRPINEKERQQQQNLKEINENLTERIESEGVTSVNLENKEEQSSNAGKKFIKQKRSKAEDKSPKNDKRVPKGKIPKVDDSLGERKDKLQIKEETAKHETKIKTKFEKDRLNGIAKTDVSKRREPKEKVHKRAIEKIIEVTEKGVAPSNLTEDSRRYKKTVEGTKPHAKRKDRSPEESSTEEKYSDEDELHLTSSESSESTRQNHRSFTILDDNGEKRKVKIKKTRFLKKQRSQSDDSKFREEKRERDAYKRSKIPTPVFNLRKDLSKSDRHLDQTVDKIKDSRIDTRIPSLQNLIEEPKYKPAPRSESNLSAPLRPSAYSDNERSASELEETTRSAVRRRRLRKRIRPRDSKSAGSDYESSNLIDSGFEPSPRSSRIPKWRNMSQRGVNMTSVTQSIQSNIRRYHLERKIFQHLLELKRLQIRSGQHNEAVLVKRAIDDYHNSCASTVGAGRYVPEDYSFKTFEKFLYHSLRKLQKNGSDYLKGLPVTSDNPLLCTQSTHRCLHASHAYTGIPCAAYLPRMDHHSIPKIGFSCKPSGFLPHIHPKKSVTLELSHGNDKQVISLPADRLDQNKRYYVTFTVKGQEHNSPAHDNQTKQDAHRHAKSV